MSEWIVVAPFDPITEQELRWILRRRNELHADSVIVKPNGEGIASLAQRQEMVRRNMMGSC